MELYLIDGTYELFRHYFALPSHANRDGEEVAATRGALGFILGMLESGVTHLGVATDHVIESFRNELWPGYKTSQGVDEPLLAQFPLFEEGLFALGVACWPMVELEADDALAAAAAFARQQPAVDRVYICSPDKDLAQCVSGPRVVQLLDRRTGKVRDEAGVMERFGVPPAAVPDYLALVGDKADGYPGLAGWGEKSAASVLARYGRIEDIPLRPEAWDLPARGADKLCRALAEGFELALLFKDLATLRTHSPALSTVDEMRWRGPAPSFEEFCRRIDAPQLLQRARSLAGKVD